MTQPLETRALSPKAMDSYSDHNVAYTGQEESGGNSLIESVLKIKMTLPTNIQNF